MQDPARIREVHLDYLRAGAHVATSSSYQATFAGFQQRGLSREEAARLMRDSITLAQQARTQFLEESPEATSLFVAASIGCYGAALHDGSEYRGAYGLSRRQLIDWHRPRLETLLEAGPDLLACETIPCLLEAERWPGCSTSAAPAWFSFSCQDDTRLFHGEALTEAGAALSESTMLGPAGRTLNPLQHAILACRHRSRPAGGTYTVTSRIPETPTYIALSPRSPASAEDARPP